MEIQGTFNAVRFYETLAAILSKKHGVEINTFESKMSWNELKLNSDGMIPVVVQDYKNLEVLKIEQDFEKTQALSEEVTLESLSKMPMAHRLGGYLFSLIGPLM